MKCCKDCEKEVLGQNKRCEECKKYKKKEYDKKYREENTKYYQKYYKERKKEYREEHKKYKKEHKEEIREHNKKYYQENKEQRKKYYQENKEQRKKYTKKRRREDPLFRLRCNYSSLFSVFLNKQGTSKKGKSCMDFVSYTQQELKAHLESLFTDGMNWDNYGRKGWEIDHIIPSIFFDAYDSVEIKYCWSLDNLRPMWAKDNDSKKDKIILWGKKVNARDLVIPVWKK